MIVVKLIGGLGNQLFQYATAKALALHKGQELYIDKNAFNNYELRAYGLHNFNIKAKTYKQPSKFIRKLLVKFGINTNYKEQSFAYNSELFKIKSRNILLDGFFQCEKYFLEFKSQILKDFEITSPLKKETQEQLKNIAKVNSVSIHIRRGDYLLNEKHNTSKKEFYKEAMSSIEREIENPVYFMFSDDMEWVKANFKTNTETVYIDFNDAYTDYEDLKLMAACKHNIIANSSFSWWAAWLNTNTNKTVIAPQQWFNDESQDYSDVIPNTWIKL